MLFVLLVVSFLFSGALCLNCHSCGGADNIPNYALNALTQANLTGNVSYWGDCTAKSGNDVCSNGLFCYKNAVVYKFSLAGIIGYTWTTYQKGCTNVRLDNGALPQNTCYDINSTNVDGYTQTVRQCYCQSPDLCNSKGSLSMSLFLFLFSLYLSR